MAMMNINTQKTACYFNRLPIQLVGLVYSAVLYLCYLPMSYSLTLAEQLTVNDEVGHAEISSIRQQSQDVSIVPVMLQDNSGLRYIGGLVNERDLGHFLALMKQELKGKFSDYRRAQQQRDHHQFHITLVNPFELKALDNEQVNLLLKSKRISFALLGLGKVEKSSTQATYFVVAESEQAQLLRKHLALPEKDFHVTLGFNQQDVFGVNKDRSTLVKTQ